MNETPRSFSPLLDRFYSDAPYIGLEKIKLSIERGQKKDTLSYLLFVILLPGAMYVFLKVKSIIKSHKNIDSFKNLVEQELILIIFATIFYGAMWWHLFPIVTSCWNLFYQHYSWQEFFVSLTNWNTLQALILFSINFFISQLALKSFTLTPTFEDRYQFLKLLAKARYEEPVIKTNAINEIIRGKAEMMQNIINQAFNAMLASDELEPETADKIIKIVKNSYYEIIGDYTSEPKFSVGEAHLETQDFPAFESKKDEDW